MQCTHQAKTLHYLSPVLSVIHQGSILLSNPTDVAMSPFPYLAFYHKSSRLLDVSSTLHCTFSRRQAASRRELRGSHQCAVSRHYVDSTKNFAPSRRCNSESALGVAKCILSHPVPPADHSAGWARWRIASSSK